MKCIRIILVYLMISVPCIVRAQIPQKFNYQGVARNISGNPIANSTIGLQLSITDGFTTLYSETFAPTTNTLGLFNVEVGNGSVVVGTFSTIDWLSGNKYLKIEMDPTGGTTYINMGTVQLLSVPFALASERASNVPTSYLWDISSGLTLTTSLQYLLFNGTQDLTFTVTRPSNIIVTYSQTGIMNFSGGGANAWIDFNIQLKDNLNILVNQVYTRILVPNMESTVANYTHHCYIAAPGTYKINILAYLLSTDPDVSISGPVISPPYSPGQVSLLVVPT